MTLPPEKLAELEIDACQSEKRDRMNARIQIWSLLVGLIGAFGLASIQSGAVGYVVLLYPLLAACIARHAGHSEKVLDQLKAYLYQQEESSGFHGYEHFNRTSRRTGIGNHGRALRDALLLTDLLAIVAVVVRLFLDGWYWLIGPVILLELVSMYFTCRWLSGK